MVEKLGPFYKLPKTFVSVKKALSDACELALKQLFQENCLAQWRMPALDVLDMHSWLKTNANKKTVKAENVRPVSFGSKFFSPAQLKMSKCSIEFLANYMAFLDFAHIL